MATNRPRQPLTIGEVLTMTEEDMRIECIRLQIPASGLDKSAVQRQLLGHIVARATSTPASHTTAPPVYAAGTTDQLGPDLQGLDLVDLNLEESDHGLSPRVGLVMSSNSRSVSLSHTSFLVYLS